jgi:hypothetical protein
MNNITTSELVYFLTTLNNMLAKSIKTNKRSSKFKRVIVQVTDNVYDHLKQKFNLNGRYKIYETFIDHFNLVNFDFLNSSDFNEIDKLTVELRLHQKRKITIHDSQDNLHDFFSPKFLSMKFFVSEKKRKI